MTSRWRPSRSVPVTRWRAESRWRFAALPFAVLALGQLVFGVGEGLLVQAGLGVSPWTVLAQGVTVRSGLPIGLTTFLTSVAVLLLWIPIREIPGIGTIANIVFIASALQVTVDVVPAPGTLWLRLGFVLAGIVVIGIGSGLYLTANLGPGPRDGWMTGLHKRFNWPIPAVRLGIESLALLIGWLLGGTVGIGTVLFAVLIGPAVGYGLQFAALIGRPAHPEPDVPGEEFPGSEA